MMNRWRMGAALILVAVTGSAWTHHSMDLADAKPIHVEGDVEFVSWDGAHVVYDVRGADASGELRTWAIMGASPRILRARGIAKTTFKVGDRITVTGRFDPHTLFIAPDYFIAADSTRYQMGFYPTSMASR
jgi:hypothetical protein